MRCEACADCFNVPNDINSGTNGQIIAAADSERGPEALLAQINHDP
jgi:hypothetical protein